MSHKTEDQEWLVEQLQFIAQGIGKTLSPFCEVVLHDLTDSENTIMVIENNLSGRKVGDRATELGMARIESPDFPQIVANYPNQFPDGRTAKSTSIGIKDKQGNYVAALCLNIDISMIKGLQMVLNQFSTLEEGNEIIETFSSVTEDSLKKRIDEFSATYSVTPRALKPHQRRELLLCLQDEGYLSLRKAMEITAQYLGVSRATVYNDLKE